MRTIKYVAVNSINKEPLYESDSYFFLIRVIQKLAAKSVDTSTIKIYKKVITETVEEVKGE